MEQRKEMQKLCRKMNFRFSVFFQHFLFILQLRLLVPIGQMKKCKINFPGIEFSSHHCVVIYKKCVVNLKRKEIQIFYYFFFTIGVVFQKYISISIYLFDEINAITLKYLRLLFLCFLLWVYLIYIHVCSFQCK